MEIETNNVRNFHARLDNARTLADIFEVVKSAVWESRKKSRGGIMLGLANLGNHPQGFFGAFYPVGSNVIVMNKIPLERISETRPELYKPYIFHVLLHEYLHTLGYLSESGVRQMVLEITKEAFGEEHLATRIAADTTHFFKNLVYPDAAWQADDMRLELVEGFDRGSASYIA
ncbi:MAG: hypothetical protein ABOK23_12555 [Candidatus Methanoperedens sp.]|nr:hypothetical protein [Candidatus Methanoperedens sp.]MCZ7396661.1 hypothetical protein [Candidatus Methanoperedens sp.]